MRDPAMTDFRARGTIMGPAGLTAVFGMGTGGAPQVSSPESAGGAVRPARLVGRSGSRSGMSVSRRGKAACRAEGRGEQLGRRLTAGERGLPGGCAAGGRVAACVEAEMRA